MDLDDTSAPEVTDALTSRKTPRLPPTRQSPLKHTSIGGSPRRSSVKRAVNAQDDEDGDTPEQPAANRRLDFNRNRQSANVVDSRSPFKPRKVLRRSMNARPDPFALEDDETAKTSIEYTNRIIEDDDDNMEQSIEGDDGPIMMDDDTLDPEQYTEDVEEIGMPGEPTQMLVERGRGRPRKSDQPTHDSQIQLSPNATTKKRGRRSLDDSEVVAESSARRAMGPPAKKTRSSNVNKVDVHRDDTDPSEIPGGDEPVFDDEDSNILPRESQANLDSQLQTQEEAQPAKKRKGRPPKGKKNAAPKERDPNRAMGVPVTATGSPVKLNDSPSKRHRGGSIGPVSNVALRAMTPHEDARKISRAGRNCIEPLKFWENESRIWKNGEIEGIIRAEHVEKPQDNHRRKRRGRKRTGGRLAAIEAESETESVMPDEWEETMGVITGNVANWNATTKAGDSNDPVQEDIAFASSSIITRDVAGSEFKYAKIMTIPFFGAGVVELPPEGFKRAKNSRKMQMVFFVHEGKVLVEVGATGMEVNQFALSKGGVWIVPRGNNYAITNESRTKSVKIFFAQGCVVEGAE
ncbi:hypothetical protein DOTSEDRAFT_69770 [Dothistroma septosporum NZE10]|uniref:Mif2/CENP-C cupin domain-containing protein n=1 Tax=Dothistroma septosporum (strain NZE10 / CBS 128990) TaxID=675120 RepID=N1PY80_DOTSN|nr:hypothetical protein DOTSEDRAFT_69770 [Dothistroma septosporum NZE10]